MNRARAAAVVSCWLATCFGVGAVTAEATTRYPAGTPSAEIYRKAPTASCLRRNGVAVAAIKPLDRRLRALRDLAQKTSWQASTRTRVVGVALNRTRSDAELLVELLRVPNDRYRVERRSNAVLLYLPTAAALVKTVRGCLS